MEILFLNAKYLWLLLSLPFLILIHIFSLRFLKTRAWIFANYEAIRRVSGEDETMKNARVIRKNFWLLLVQILIISFIILAISKPVYVYKGQSTTQSFALAIDTSGSMLANDLQPNRLEAAKNAAEVFLNAITEKTRLGIVTFSGTSIVENQMTDNIDDVKSIVKDIEIGRTGGTDIGGAIITSGNLMISEKSSKAIILITDGRSTVGTSIEEGITYANSNQIIVNTIAIGTLEGGSFAGNDSVSTVDEAALTDIADKTGGKYFRADTETKLSDALKSLITSKTDNVSVELESPMLLLALSIIFLQWGLVNTRYRTLP